MEELLRRVGQADDQELSQIIKAVIARYEGLYPDWEVMFLSLPRGAGREQALRETLEFIRRHEI